ncbi:hypothetical protein FB567DRAFT_596850 [Paraphoma chrysanthemicola]|uniref:Metalloendopeptidase n=1 Tax=Paraphoma chrysanthemicola TaxID=798071 RepID=A0A8K0QZD4_9PLEO|nr:hypothetical protein FB567DRAFT_596850 [Paraphoma chrysanthemicola]
MKLLALLFFLAALATACPPLFNDFYYLGNETHSTASLVRDLFKQQPQLGWSEIVTMTGKPLSTWPTGKIAYCFDQPKTRNNLESDLKEAWKVWHDKLGDASQANSHKLRWLEFAFWDKEWPYCFLERHSPSDPWVWNPIVPYSVAMIMEWETRLPNMAPSSVIGYIPQDWQRGNAEGRMGMRLNLHQAGDFHNHQHWIAALAHELGHIFGLYHEHQRPDRDHWVRFNCAALPGYDRAKEMVTREGNHDMKEVCSNGALAATYSFGAVKSFDTIPHLDPGSEHVGKDWWWFQHYADRDYDDQSIMHYDSDADYWRNDDELLRVRLAKWHKRGADFNPPTKFSKDDLEYCYVNFQPSQKDVDGIKKLYPWSG